MGLTTVFVAGFGWLVFCVVAGLGFVTTFVAGFDGAFVGACAGTAVVFVSSFTVVVVLDGSTAGPDVGMLGAGTLGAATLGAGRLDAGNVAASCAAGLPSVGAGTVGAGTVGAGEVVVDEITLGVCATSRFPCFVHKRKPPPTKTAPTITIMMGV